MYNLTCYDNITNTLEMTQCSNYVSGGIFFPIIFMLVLFVILLISFKMISDTIVSVIGASFIVGIVGVIGWLLEMVSDKIVFIPLFLLIGSVIAYMLSD